MFFFTRIWSRSQSRPKTGRLLNPAPGPHLLLLTIICIEYYRISTLTFKQIYNETECLAFSTMFYNRGRHSAPSCEHLSMNISVNYRAILKSFLQRIPFVYLMLFNMTFAIILKMLKGECHHKHAVFHPRETATISETKPKLI